MLAGLGLGIGSFLTGKMLGATETPGTGDQGFWKYARVDPAKVADMTYEIYPQGACMYAVTRSLLSTIAEALRSVDPLAAVTVRSFPFHMMRYGHGGVAGTGTTCGAFNGGAAVIGLFVQDADRRDAMIRELCFYYENSSLPKYKPKDDKFPNMKSVVSESVLCHISSSRWRVEADAKMFGQRRVDRCRRLSADIAAKTAEIMNRNHTDKTCPMGLVPQPTQTCFDCHGPKGNQADSIGVSNCATCHEHDDTHSNKYLKPLK